MGKLFWGFSKFQASAPRPNMGAENVDFLKLLKSMIVGALWLRLGLLSIK